MESILTASLTGAHLIAPLFDSTNVNFLSYLTYLAFVGKKTLTMPLQWQQQSTRPQ